MGGTSGVVVRKDGVLLPTDGLLVLIARSGVLFLCSGVLFLCSGVFVRYVYVVTKDAADSKCLPAAGPASLASSCFAPL